MISANPTYSIMAHMIPYFPTLDGSLKVAQGIIEGRARYLEIQFPYSDPSADGPDIQAAGAKALMAGFTVANGWQFIDRVRELPGSAEVPLFLMSYAGMVFAQGLRRFVRDAAKHGVCGLIVPDLPSDSDEGLAEAAAEAQIEVVPVVPINVPAPRLREILSSRPRYLYVSLRVGITGAETKIDPALLSALRLIREQGVRVLAGFGVSKVEQVRLLAPDVDAVVVGSAIVRAVHGAPPTADLAAVVRDRLHALNRSPH